MKQVYATGPLAASAGPTANPAVKATSTGTKPDAVQTALSFANYLPPQTNGETPAKMPVRLSFLSTANTGRVLTHVAPNGGTYFAHSLLDVPNGTDAHTAIQTWGSNQWQRHESQSGSELPELPFLPVADVLDDESVKIWLCEPTHRELLEYTFSALLSTPPSARVILAASADDVAAVVYAVTRAFPSSLTDDFTFSTYEPEPLSCRARLIGRDPGPNGADLHDNCYSDDSFGYNPVTGRKSLLPREVGFAAFAVDSLATGDFAKLDDFRGTWERLGLKDSAQFDLIDRLFRDTGEYAKYEIATIVQMPAVASWLASRPAVVRQLTEWAIDDRVFATGPYGRVVQAIRQKPEMVAKLSEAIKGAGFAAVTAGETTQAGNAFDVILPMVSPAKAASVWSELPSKIADPATLSWPMRWHLLPRLVRAKQPTPATVSTELSKWFAVPADQLADLLALELPKSHLIHATREAWKKREDGVNDTTLVSAIAKYPSIAMTVLKPEHESDADGAAKLFTALLHEAPSRPWFEDVVASASDYPKPLLNRFFEAELAAGRGDIDRIVRTQGSTILELFAGQSGLDTLGTRFLSSPPADLLNQHGILEFLKSLRDQAGISDELKERISAVLEVRAYHDQPTFTAEAMAPIAKALDLAPTPLPANTKTETFRIVAAELAKRSDGEGFQDDLESAMMHFGSTLAKGPTDLFQDILRELRHDPDFAKHPNLVTSTLAVSLGAVKSAEFAGQIDGLEPDAFAIASDAAKAGKRKLLEEIDRRSADWPKNAKAKWGFLLEAVRPRGARIGRDVFCTLFGAALVGLAWGLITVFKQP